jgi:hypothetical protein
MKLTTLDGELLATQPTLPCCSAALPLRSASSDR